MFKHQLNFVANVCKTDNNARPEVPSPLSDFPDLSRAFAALHWEVRNKWNRGKARFSVKSIFFYTIPQKNYSFENSSATWHFGQYESESESQCEKFYII